MKSRQASARGPRLSAPERRRVILDAAKEIFLVEGYDRTTMRQIAAKVGVTPTTLYLHFADKETLLREICDESFGKLDDGFKAILAAASSPEQAFRAFLDVYVGFGLSHPREYRLLFMTEPPAHVSCHRPPAGEAAWPHFDPQDRGAQAFDALASLVKLLMDQGIFRPGDPIATAEVVWAAAHGLVALLVTNPCFPWSDRALLVDKLAEMVGIGLAVRPVEAPVY